MTLTVRLIVHTGEDTLELRVAVGANLRQTLLDAGLSPYAALTRRANCGGRGLCATCGVGLDDGSQPGHWHDRLAERFGYPRLSCQVTVEQDMVVWLLPEKRIWGGRRQRP
jgi:ferredoxin